jgi:hypothetical protein
LNCKTGLCCETRPGEIQACFRDQDGRNIHATAAQIEAMMTERDIMTRFSTTI